MVLERHIVAHAVGGLPAVMSAYPCSTLVSQHEALCYADAIKKVTDQSSTPQPTASSSWYSAENNAIKITNLYSSFFAAQV